LGLALENGAIEYFDKVWWCMALEKLSKTHGSESEANLFERFLGFGIEK
jgi:hypothetical protein